MFGEQAAKVISALPPLIWALLAAFVVWILRTPLTAAIGRLTTVEAFSVKLALSGSQAMNAAIEIARKNPQWNLDIPAADVQRALDRANRERSRLEGAEILWVDDCPSNDRNEARMLRSFGAMITFACTTEEALQALTLGVDQSQPFHLILSDIRRELPVVDPVAGVSMIGRIRAEKFHQPIVFYVGNVEPDRGIPPGAFGITNRPDRLLHLVLDALARTRAT